jgi:hypothetical protein
MKKNEIEMDNGHNILKNSNTQGTCTRKLFTDFIILFTIIS